MRATYSTQLATQPEARGISPLHWSLKCIVPLSFENFESNFAKVAQFYFVDLFKSQNCASFL